MRMPPSRAGCRSLRHCPTCRKLSSQLAPSDPSHAVAAVGGLRPTHCGSTSPEPRATKPSREGKKEGAWLLKLSRCLLYTSDAADEEDSVDLGGRRIIKKKKKKKK